MAMLCAQAGSAAGRAYKHGKIKMGGRKEELMGGAKTDWRRCTSAPPFVKRVSAGATNLTVYGWSVVVVLGLRVRGVHMRRRRPLRRLNTVLEVAPYGCSEARRHAVLS